MGSAREALVPVPGAAGPKGPRAAPPPRLFGGPAAPRSAAAARALPPPLSALRGEGRLREVWRRVAPAGVVAGAKPPVPGQDLGEILGSPARALVALLVVTGFKSTPQRPGHWRRLCRRLAGGGLAAQGPALTPAASKQSVALVARGGGLDLVALFAGFFVSIWDALLGALGAAAAAATAAATAGGKPGELPRGAGAADGSALASPGRPQLLQAAKEAAAAIADGARGAAREAKEGLQALETWYQNEVGSLINDRGEPITVSLRIIERKRFELKVERLNSPHGGSEGWFTFQGELELRPHAGAQKADVQLLAADAAEAFKYDARTLESATAFAFGCLKRCGTAVLNALRLEMDLAKNCVIVTPHAPVVRLLWYKQVVLAPIPCPQMQMQALAA